MLILGDMLELGEKSEEEHLRLLIELQFQKNSKSVILVGNMFQKECRKIWIQIIFGCNRAYDYLKKQTLRVRHSY